MFTSGSGWARPAPTRPPRGADEEAVDVLTDREVSAAIGGTAFDSDGEKIGTVQHFFVDDRTGEPTWVAVTTGLFGTRHSVVPAGAARFEDGVLRLPVRKDAVRHAPEVPDAVHLDPATEDRLRDHYGVGGPEAAVTPEPAVSPAPAGVPAAAPIAGATPPSPAAQDAPSAQDAPPAQDPSAAQIAPEAPGSPGRHAAPDDASSTFSPTDTGVVPVGAVGRPSSGAGSAAGGEEPPGPVAVPEDERAAARAPAPGDGSMVRSEEQLRVGAERVASRRVRLVKFVVTEEVQVTVPVRREEVRLEEVPLDERDAAAAPAGESLLPADADPGGGLPGEIVLHAERPVVSVEVVPVERVRLRTETVTDDHTVTDQVQRERIVLDQS
jgi:stress response protein YsnF